jgi:hypothetical protein
MEPYVLATLTILAFGLMYLAYRIGRGIVAFFRMHGTRLVTCPENKETAAIGIDPHFAALTATVSDLQMRIGRCSRWPEKEGCAQACLPEVKEAPDDTRVEAVAKSFFVEHTCSYCGRKITDADALGHKAALENAAHELRTWDKVPAQMLPTVFTVETPVCWNCYVIERFRREHPELATPRDFNVN